MITEPERGYRGGIHSIPPLRARLFSDPIRYTPPMRRILAIVLLIAFGSPLILPALASSAAPQRNLPACCRRNGTHHCNGGMTTPNAPAFATQPCPNYPSPAATLCLTHLAVPTPAAATIALLSTASPQSATHAPAHFFISTANLTRGPPTLLT